MKIEELNQEQIEKARSLATNEERLDYLKACGVELDDDMLAEIDGGHLFFHYVDTCQTGPNKGKQHKWKYANKTKKLFGLWEFKEMECVYCGKTRRRKSS